MADEARTKVVGYCRVSTEGQADEGVSLAAQRAKLEGFAMLYDLELVQIIEDAGVSAKTLDRPGLKAALAMLDSGEAEGLLIAKLDRLTRRVVDLGLLIDRYFSKACALLSVAEQFDTRSAAGRLVLNVLVSVAQWEREAVSERTKDALAHLKSNGVRLGGVGLGWERTDERDANGHLVVREVQGELLIVERIRKLRDEGRSLREIARQLELEGRPTKRGGQWSHRTVAGVLRRVSA